MKSVVRITDSPQMTSAVNCDIKKSNKQEWHIIIKSFAVCTDQIMSKSAIIRAEDQEEQHR